ncbi:YqeG family HAD IIIA-type phosphatase [Pseudothermotoga thermarum]|uniref:Hydrolase, HAD-superfamily, subfamily IIIA n=1 Tax=Pseudothermotoga thermarum DSM 5069 TaxID=688269 RepID=F7YTQ3_9THEM|nr:YqeG family HAD IIIA-type phosphatase [Pseudothermotoga thermarum]AEH51279.1 hydrolase, HAD-superfamily, subfamily IIIA [Pseudothermotoga thermarum DSM 5069]
MIFKPDMIVEKVDDIDFEKLIKQGKTFFIFDFDNTLGYWRSSKILDGFEKILQKIKEAGGEVLIASNGKPRKLCLDGVEVFWRSGKPFAFKLRKVLKEKGVKNDQIVMIGDQIFTDVLVGKFLKAYTIKVEPLSKKEFFGTKFFRFLELITKPLWKR